MELWDAEAEALPRTRRETVVLLTGLLLPIWRVVPSNSERIWRVTPEDGRALIGRAISPEPAPVLRGRFRDGATPDEMVVAAMASGGAVELGRGLVLRARRAAGARGLELEGRDVARVSGPRAAGCFTEIVAHQLRVFVSVGGAALGVIEAIPEGRAAMAEPARGATGGRRGASVAERNGAWPGGKSCRSSVPRRRSASDPRCRLCACARPGPEPAPRTDGAIVPGWSSSEIEDLGMRPAWDAGRCQTLRKSTNARSGGGTCRPPVW